MVIPLHLPFRSLIEEFKVTKIRTALQYKISKDEKVAEAGIEVCSGRKWKASREFFVKKRYLERSQKGPRVFGFFLTNLVDNSSYKSKRRLIQDKDRKGEDEIRLPKIVGLKQQGTWINWNSTMQRKIKWCEIWNDYPNVRFFIRYVCSTMWLGCQSRRFNCLFWREIRQRILGHEISPYPEVVRGRE